MSKKRKKNRSNWIPPENYKEFFYASSDEPFKKAHPVGYFFLVTVGITALLLPAVLFSFTVGEKYGWENTWIFLGYAGGFVFGFGIFNYLGIIIRQFLGHWVSIISFLIGGAMMFISWLLCR